MKTRFAADRATAVVVSKTWDVLSDFNEYLPEFDIPFMFADSLEAVPYDFLRDYQATYVFVSIDDFGGPTIVYNQLRGLRQNMPNTAVILVSSEFAVDEFGTHRLMLADVSLRFPFSKSSLLFALNQAPVNLSTWRERVASQAHSPTPLDVSSQEVVTRRSAFAAL
ncbi:hypothetical protein [uncultured Roseovarius sp.]|uniref:hypothetical protein n=1 Tax=uncultured Roseovarius sp. TaxID=293344 RepID=UPI0025F2AC52|nr:hypothetical protein [uncultured Roseovarius sp.]